MAPDAEWEFNSYEKFVSDLRQVDGFLRVLWFSPPIKLTAIRYNWNIVESGVKTNKQYARTRLPASYLR